MLTQAIAAVPSSANRCKELEPQNTQVSQRASDDRPRKRAMSVRWR
jgi:hypothetical protein